MAIGKEVTSAVEKYECEAGNNCWLRSGHEYCGICKRGDQKTWRTKCDEKRVQMGMKSYAEIAQMLSAK